jgi:hypothetical protein
VLAGIGVDLVSITITTVAILKYAYYNSLWLTFYLAIIILIILSSLYGSSKKGGDFYLYKNYIKKGRRIPMKYLTHGIKSL